MNKTVCGFGILLIVVSVLIITHSETVTEQIENDAYRQWANQREPIGIPPERWTIVYRSIYPYTILGGIVLLIGFTALVIGSQMPEK